MSENYYHRFRLKKLLLFTLFALLVGTSGCGKPFRVSPQIRTGLSPLTGQAMVKGLVINAAAITDEDELMSIFNANTRLARILVIRLTLANQGDGSVNLRRLRWKLMNDRDRKFDALKPKEAVEKLYDYYDIHTYQIMGRKAVEADFQREAFPTESDVGVGEERRGLLFFEVPKKVDTLTPFETMTLYLERLRWSTSNRPDTIELRLNR